MTGSMEPNKPQDCADATGIVLFYNTSVDGAFCQKAPNATQLQGVCNRKVNVLSA